MTHTLAELDTIVGELTEAQNDKLDRDCQNVDTNSGADGVIEYQAPTSSNGYRWYRLYKSGWVEQGGITTSQSGNITINLLKTMSDTKYTLLVATEDLDGNAYNATTAYFTKTASSFQTNNSLGGSYFTGSEISWEVKGMSAQN